MAKTGAEVVAYARQYIDKIQYVFGASTDSVPNGKGDCSSFTQYIYRECGYDIPRTCSAVYNAYTVRIPKEELQLGDIVFFTKTYGPDGGYTGATHIGIYSGNGKFIHLGSSGCKESDLSYEYWVNHYYGATRIVDNEGTITETETNNTESNNIGLVWWGDVINVVLCIMLLIGGGALLVIGVKDIVTNKIGG